MYTKSLCKNQQNNTSFHFHAHVTLNFNLNRNHKAFFIIQKEIITPHKTSIKTYFNAIAIIEDTHQSYIINISSAQHNKSYLSLKFI